MTSWSLSRVSGLWISPAPPPPPPHIGSSSKQADSWQFQEMPLQPVLDSCSTCYLLLASTWHVGLEIFDICTQVKNCIPNKHNAFHLVAARSTPAGVCYCWRNSPSPSRARNFSPWVISRLPIKLGLCQWLSLPVSALWRCTVPIPDLSWLRLWKPDCRLAREAEISDNKASCNNTKETVQGAFLLSPRSPLKCFGTWKDAKIIIMIVVIIWFLYSTNLHWSLCT